MADEKPPTEIGTDLLGIGKAAGEILKAAEPFLMKLVGPYLDARGEMLADGVREKRRQNLLVIAAQAAAHVGEQEMKTVPGRVLFPMLEAASNEEAPELQRMWAALMAQATIDPDTVPPAFPKILSELSGLEARILAFLHEDLSKQGSTMDPKHYIPVSIEDLAKRYDVSPDPLLLAFANFHRLGLIMPALLPAEQNMLLSISEIRMTITPYGSALVSACSPIQRAKE